MMDEQFEFLKDVAKLLEFISKTSFIVTAGELWRPPEMQALYLQQGKSKAAHSKHQDRLAIDLNFFTQEKRFATKAELKEIGGYWESLNKKNRWGGNFHTIEDTPHFERNI